MNDEANDSVVVMGITRESQGNFHPKHTTGETVVFLFMSFWEERLRCLLLWVPKESDSWCSTEFPSLSLKILFLSCVSCTGRKYCGRRKESKDDTSCEPGKYSVNQSIYFINPACGGLCCVVLLLLPLQLLYFFFLYSFLSKEEKGSVVNQVLYVSSSKWLTRMKGKEGKGSKSQLGPVFFVVLAWVSIGLSCNKHSQESGTRVRDVKKELEVV